MNRRQLEEVEGEALAKEVRRPSRQPQMIEITMIAGR